MKKFTFFLLVLYCSYSCNNKDKTLTPTAKSYTINGTVTGIKNGMAMFQIFNAEQPKTDTVKIVNGKFTYTNNAPYPQLAIVVINNLTEIIGKSLFFVEPSSAISIAFDSSKKEKFIIKGSNANDEFITMKEKFIAPIEEKEKQVLGGINPMNVPNQQTMDSLMKLANGFQQEKKDAMLKYIKNNKTSYVAGAYAFLVSMQDENTKFLEEVYTVLGDSIKKSFYGTEMKRKIDAVSKTEVGATTPDFTVNDINDKPVKLSDFYKGKKIVLIDFWASWCGPCRRENPNIVKTYSQYHSKGFEIIGVSLDENKKDWQDAVKKDNLTWMHVSDLKGWECVPARLYNVQGIPMNFLIDGNGKILASNLRGPELEAKLKEFLK